jgi:hypothetical protein
MEMMQISDLIDGMSHKSTQQAMTMGVLLMLLSYRCEGAGVPFALRQSEGEWRVWINDELAEDDGETAFPSLGQALQAGIQLYTKRLI